MTAGGLKLSSVFSLFLCLVVRCRRLSCLLARCLVHVQYVVSCRVVI